MIPAPAGAALATTGLSPGSAALAADVAGPATPVATSEPVVGVSKAKEASCDADAVPLSSVHIEARSPVTMDFAYAGTALVRVRF